MLIERGMHLIECISRHNSCATMLPRCTFSTMHFFSNPSFRDVGKNLVVPGGAKVIDAHKKLVIPGNTVLIILFTPHIYWMT